MTPAIVAGLLAGYGIAIPVGAVGAYLVALTARTSLRVGLIAALGVATVDGGYALAAMLGGGALTRLIAPLAGVLRWLAAGVLIVMAAHIARTAVRRHRSAPTAATSSAPEPGARSLPRVYATLVTMTLLNPATIVYFAAVVLGGQAGTSDTWAERSAFVLAAFAASASWQAVLAGGGALLGRALTGPRGRLGTALTSSAVIAVLAVRTGWG